MRYFVHIYHVVRSKVLVEADDHKQAIEKADDGLAEVNRRLFFERLSSLEEEVKMAPQFDAISLPYHLQTESAEEVSGYMVDEVGDEEYERSLSYDAEGNINSPLLASNLLIVTPAERDTILAALRYWQRNVADRSFRASTLPEWEIALNGNGDEYALNGDAIDSLCERINS